MKKLYKSKKDVKICGVCGGIAEYLNIDSTIVRLLWTIACLLYGTGILIYIICAFVLPNDNSEVEIIDASKKESKKLYRSSKDSKICGVCGGLAEFLHIDPSIVRILWIIFSFFGIGVMAYIVCALVIPKK